MSAAVVGAPGPGHWFEALADRLGSAYLRYSFTLGTEQEADFLVEALGLEPGDRVLDLGCGPGRHVWALAERGIDVVGLDVARRFLEVGAAGGAGSGGGAGSPGRVLGWLRADATAVPLASGSVDAVVSLCQGAFGLPGPAGFEPGPELDERILAEVARVLRPGGGLALTAFSAYFQVRWLEEADSFDADRGVNHEWTEIRDEAGGRHEAELWTGCYTPRELRLLLVAVGLVEEGVWSVAPGEYERRAPEVDRPELLVLARRPGGRA